MPADLAMSLISLMELVRTWVCGSYSLAGGVEEGEMGNWG